ncbi:MAG: hypothetical protein ACR2I0_10315 [Rhodoferax sp.]
MHCQNFSILLLAALSSAALHAQTPEASAPEALDLGGRLSLQWDQRQPASLGPLALANALQDGTATLPADSASAELELRARGRRWNASATLQQQAGAGQGTQGTAWFNELVWHHDAGQWQFSGGKKIVGWDVGYAFRPNDMVQQEQRHTLSSSTAEGRPVLMVEQFDADSAWSLVAVNPLADRGERAGKEPALALRYYQRAGNADWYGFARSGIRTGNSLGAALAWVASDALELHASLRTLAFADSSVAPAGAALQAASPWQAATVADARQALVGLTWTSASQFSLLLEAWWDGSALSPTQWDDWRSRNLALYALAAAGAPLRAAAGNLAWQADAFSASSNLRQRNLLARLSWEHEGWQPALDLLYHPDDAGALLSAALLYQGDRWQLQGGLRWSVGPAAAVLSQLPTSRQGYLRSIWAF